MQADFAVELGEDDQTLEVPWAGGPEGPQYYDLKRHPELLRQVQEAQRCGELAEFLAVVNSNTGQLETAKCDAWASAEINPEEEIFGVAHKFGCYVDLLFSDDRAQCSLSDHELWAQRLVELLKKAPEIPAAAEFLIRRCYYHVADGTREGFYITFYMFGYGEDEPAARQQWAIGLKLAGNAIRQMSWWRQFAGCAPHFPLSPQHR